MFGALKLSIFLSGLSLQFYRGIGAEVQYLAPFTQFNFFIGANNAGKSIVLNFLSIHLKEIKAQLKIDHVERYRGGVSGEPKIEYAIKLEDFVRNASSIYDGASHNSTIFQSFLSRVSTSLSRDRFIWGSFVNGTWTPTKELSRHDQSQIADDQTWYAVWNAITNQSGGAMGAHWFPETMRRLVGAQEINIPAVEIIPAKRQIELSGTAFDFKGGGLIDRLAEIQSPGYDKLEDRKLFAKINHFLQTVTGKSDARVEIPHHREHVLVHMDNKVLPLSSLGTGIHEVIMIAAFCTIAINKIVCIEEPEIHLHPLLQRKLIKYLQENTSNQYFIATHSASFIDTPGSTIFHVSNDGEQTTISESVLRSSRVSICADLGYKASDIVQANSIVWVEGPSDRIYLKHWLSIAFPELQEGIHYSIMFYGGRLLSHLSASDDGGEVEEWVEDFIELKSLNQNMAIVIDSDLTSESDTINSTKSRLVDELSNGRGLAWVTAGREIENYVDHTMLQSAVRDVYEGVYAYPAAGGQYDHPLYFYRNAPKARRKEPKAGSDDLLEKTVDKVAVARAALASITDLSILDLRTKVEELGTLIRRANHLL